LGAFANCPAFRDLSGTLYREANWLVSDHLGTPRMIANKSGSLASMKRHDYLPFGEELSANIGARTPTQGYAGDNVRQKFTGYERDTETGLDYAHARQYASTQGSYTSDANSIFPTSQINNLRSVKFQTLFSVIMKRSCSEQGRFCFSTKVKRDCLLLMLKSLDDPRLR
jgi:RHS repeat-associated protein